MRVFLIQIQHDMTRPSFLYFLLLFCPILSYSQRITITGKIEITNLDEDWDYKTIQVENMVSYGKAKSNEKGIFSITVQLNDVLELSGNYLQTRTIKINENILKKGFLKVELEVEEIELTEVNVHPLKKNWQDNVSKVQSEQEKMNEMIGFNEAFKLDMVKGLLAVKYIKKMGGVPSYENMLKLKDQFTKAAKEYRPDVRKEKPQIVRHEEILQIKGFFTESYFSTSFAIPTERIYDFVSYCYDTYDFNQLLKNEQYDDMFFHFIEGADNFLESLKIKHAN